jgi:hypothetical protein
MQVGRIGCIETHKDQIVLPGRPPVDAGFGGVLGHHVLVELIAVVVVGLESFDVGICLRRESHADHAHLVGVFPHRNHVGTDRCAACD